MLPTFIVAGATKSGTTAISEYLNDHPEVCMSWMKEPNFFTREIPVSRYDKGISWYKTLFKDCGDTKAVGEVSPAYMPRKDAPRLIAQTLPKIQLLFLLRNPLDRVYSHYRYALQRGIRLPSLERMVETDHPELEEAIYVSSYHLHLMRYLDSFSRDQISIFIYEEFRAKPRIILEEIYQTIGVNPNFLSPHLGRMYNPSQQARILWLQYLMDKYGRILMVKDMPRWIYTSLRQIRAILWNLNSKGSLQNLPNHEIDKYIIPKVEEAVYYVENFLGRKLPAWREN